MTANNQPVSQASKPVNWTIIALVGVIGCICVLALGLVLGFGFSGNLPLTFLSTATPVPPTETPTPLATATPIPTMTNTPEPSLTPTFTMMPTQSVSMIVEALQAAAEGRGVPEAALYDPKKPGIHPIVVFSASDEIVNEWNAALPDAWRGQNVSLTELVAVVTNREVQLEKGHYFGSGVSLYIWRIRIDTDVIVRETRTGLTIASNTFKGGDPPPLKGRYPIGTTAVYGTLVPYEIVEIWLKSFVEK